MMKANNQNVHKAYAIFNMLSTSSGKQSINKRNCEIIHSEKKKYTGDESSQI